MSFIENHFAVSERLISRVPEGFVRFLDSRVDWNQPLIFIVGMRGVGKTTMLLQHLRRLKMANGMDTPVLYLTADDVNLGGGKLVDVVREFSRQYAGKTFVIDEVHKYPNWSQELKNLVDLEPDVQILASGSSSLSVIRGQYDLSRRSLVYSLPQLSFREFLNSTLGLDLPFLRLGELLETHIEVVSDILSAVAERGTTILERFNSYLLLGAFPYSLGKKPFDYHRQVVNSITKVLFEDVPTTFEVSSQTPVTLQRLLNLLTTSEPYEPNVERLARNLGVAKETTYNYLDHLERSGLVVFLPRSRSGSSAVRKPEKIYLANPNLYAALGQVKGLKIQRGTLRECFLLSQLAVDHTITAHETADFHVHGDFECVLEVGGRGKNRKQLGDGHRGYLAVDGIEYGLGDKVPLWLFGFLY